MINLFALGIFVRNNQLYGSHRRNFFRILFHKGCLTWGLSDSQRLKRSTHYLLDYVDFFKKKSNEDKSHDLGG